MVCQGVYSFFFFSQEVGFRGIQHQVGLQWVAKVPEAQLRIWPCVLSHFIASLKVGPLLLILLIKDTCFVKQNHPFIKTEHNFMVWVGFVLFFFSL